LAQGVLPPSHRGGPSSSRVGVQRVAVPALRGQHPRVCAVDATQRRGSTARIHSGFSWTSSHGRWKR